MGAGSNGGEGVVSTSAEEGLLEAFSLIANIDKAWCRTSSQGPASAGKPSKSTAPGKTALDVTVLMSQRNLRANSMRKFTSSVHIPEPHGDLSQFHWSPFPSELSGVSLALPSPSGTRLLLVRNPEGGSEGKEKDGPGPVKLEVWAGGRLLQDVHVAPTTHGAVYADGWFEGVSWSADETRIAYIADEPAPAKPVFGQSKSAIPAAPPPQPVVQARGRFGAPQAPAALARRDSYVGGEGGGSEAAGTWKGRGEWVEDWGEKYTGKQRPLPFVFDLTDGTVTPVEGIPADISAGQVVWAPPLPDAVGGGQPVLVFVGWSAFSSTFATARKLGMVYCTNRPCGLYAAAAPPPVAIRKSAPPVGIVKLTGGISSAYFPRFSPDGAVLAFLSAQASVESGAHAATNSLHSLVWPKDGLLFPPATMAMDDDSANGRLGPSIVPSLDIPGQVIIDVVPRSDDPGGFPGLYCGSITANPWLTDNRTLLLTTAWRSTQAIIAVHVETGRVSRLTPEGPISWTLLDVSNNAVVAGASTPACPTKLMLGRVNSGWLKQEGWLWSEISPAHVEYEEEVEAALKSTEFEVLSIAPPPPVSQPTSEGAKQPFESIFIRRQPDMGIPGAPAAPLVTAGKPLGGAAAGSTAGGMVPAGSHPPLLVVPHGGPHGVTTTSFQLSYAYLCALGYTVLHVNYRGSLGFGEEALQSLPRNVGRQDVADVIAAIDRVIELGYVDPSRVAVVGGSHGGFLAAHLIGQEPDRFRAAVMRNPVTSINAMLPSTDIPDWCFVETLGAAGVAAYSDVPSAAELQAFLKASPISYVDKVKAPTLMILGGKDRRVPPSTGLQYVHALRSQGVETKVYLFPEDNHSIDKPQSEFEQWLAVTAWLKQYL